MAGAAGHPDVAHAAASFGTLPGRRADAGLPADLGQAGPELVAERAELGPAFENGYWHENDHAQTGGFSVMSVAVGTPGRSTRPLPAATWTAGTRRAQAAGNSLLLVAQTGENVGAGGCFRELVGMPAAYSSYQVVHSYEASRIRGHGENEVRTRKIRLGREPPSGGLGTADADHAIASLYQAHYRPLVQLAALLVTDVATAEDIVQESFAAVHWSWCGLPGADSDRGTDAVLSHLRRSVVHRSRSAPRLAAAGGLRAPGRLDDGREAALLLRGADVVSALQALPACQREVTVLRYFAELSEAEIASATGLSPAAIRNHTAQAMSSLRAGLRPAGD
jgi:DNA-directed RNA polymerase specialized sigma24 family protein